MMDPITPAATPPLSSPVEIKSSFLPHKPSLSSIKSAFSFAPSIYTAPAPVAQCPHCLQKRVSTPMETTKMTPLKLQTSGLGFDTVQTNDTGSDTAISAADILLKTLKETNEELQVHCRTLHQIRLMTPSPAPSRPGSVHSLDSEAEEEATRGGHPFVSDLSDLANLSNANFRLMKTLQDKVNKVDHAEKTLRHEREALERERKMLYEMSAEVEKERIRLMGTGLGWDSYKMDGGSPRATQNEGWEGSEEEEWTEEREAELAFLERKLKMANRQWSEEQEEILEPLERLREMKSVGKKSKKLDRQVTVRVERVNSQEDKPEKSPRKKSSDKSSGFKNSLSNIRRKSSTGSMVRRDSSPGATTPTRIFKKWFP